MLAGPVVLHALLLEIPSAFTISHLGSVQCYQRHKRLSALDFWPHFRRRNPSLARFQHIAIANVCEQEGRFDRRVFDRYHRLWD